MTKPDAQNSNADRLPAKAIPADVLLEVRDLHTYFFLDGATARAVEGASFKLRRGTTLGLVGESGCGKSATSLSIMRLVQSPPGKIVRGEIFLNGRNLLELPEDEMRKVRGGEIGMIFQEPMTSFNPVLTIGEQIVESIRQHQNVSNSQAWAMAAEMLAKVDIPAPEQRVRDYPHQLSGGMRQRAMIAMALACNPKLVIADEPTTALDVTIQAQILELFHEIKQGTDSAILLVTHNLGVVAQTADEVAVMYAGRIVEQAVTRRLFANPLHPYTQGLLESVPRLGGNSARLHVIEGSVPDPAHKPAGCPFNPRCPKAMDICREKQPEISVPEPGHNVRCWAVSNTDSKPETEKQD